MPDLPSQEKLLIRALSRAVLYWRGRAQRNIELRIAAELSARKKRINELQQQNDQLRAEVFRLQRMQQRKCPQCPF